MAGEYSWKDIEQRLAEMCLARQTGRFLPLLEADIAGYLYFLFVQREAGNASLWHLNTRVFGAAENDKFDLVCGDVLGSLERQAAVLCQLGDSLSAEERRAVGSKRFEARLRPAIQPHFLLELKFFAPGFTPQQNREHFRKVLDDIARLKEVGKLCPDCRAVIIVDSRKYVDTGRSQELLRAMQGDEKLRVYICEFSDPIRPSLQLLALSLDKGSGRDGGTDSRR